jgi:hypothetical protein
MEGCCSPHSSPQRGVRRCQLFNILLPAGEGAPEGRMRVCGERELAVILEINTIYKDWFLFYYL